MTEIKLNILLIEQEDWWVAQCLEYDIGAQAGTLKDLVYEMQRSLIGYLAVCKELDVEPFANLPAAPNKYWKMWNSTKDVLAPDQAPFRAPIGLPKSEMRIAA